MDNRSDESGIPVEAALSAGYAGFGNGIRNAGRGGAVDRFYAADGRSGGDADRAGSAGTGADADGADAAFRLRKHRAVGAEIGRDGFVRGGAGRVAVEMRFRGAMRGSVGDVGL